MSAYEDQLRHVAEPAAPSERRKAVTATIEDYQALWLTDVLREYSYYGDHDYDDEDDIATAYASYIDAKVRDEGRSYVDLYAHTDVAIETLLNAILTRRADAGGDADFPMTVYRAIENEFANAFIETEEGPSPESPKVIELDGERTVVFDEAEARESYAEQQQFEAESEALREAEREMDARGIGGRKTPRVDPRYGR
jgi:hypothetical protein